VIALLAPLLAASSVQVGLERLEAEKGGPLRGLRVGLVAHAASVTADGRHAIDVLRASGIDVRRLFGPEHGLRSRAAAGEKLLGGIDPESGLPVVSLYGERTKPDPNDLRDLDALVVDLQDAGVRFYTYVSTMILCLQAAAEAGIELIVLDRPNPLGGERLEGPARDPALPPSLVSLAPGPLVHGLTLGEMARLVNGGLPRPARLTVVAMRRWRRPMTWADTGRRWIPTSPNLRTAEAAVAYPGVCLLEATNLSEGRGTTRPFEWVGAPWLDAHAYAAALEAERLPGVAFRPARFRPTFHKWAGRLCGGVQIHVTERARFQPFLTGLAVIAVARRLAPRAFRWRRPPYEFERRRLPIDILLGTDRIRKALARGESVKTIERSWQRDLARWKRRRAACLAYR